MKFFKSLTILVIGIFLISAGGCKTSKLKIPYSENSQQPYLIIDENSLSADRKEILRESREWLGVPYKYGGNSREEGVDCSGMVLMVYLNAVDKKLPRNSAAQAEFCHKLHPTDVKPGDLVFFATGKDPEKVSHVGIMLDSENFIHSSASKGVMISQITLPYWTRTFMLYGRVPGMK